MSRIPKRQLENNLYDKCAGEILMETVKSTACFKQKALHWILMSSKALHWWNVENARDNPEFYELLPDLGP